MDDEWQEDIEQIHYELLIELCNKKIRQIVATYCCMMAVDIEEVLMGYNIGAKYMPNNKALEQHMDSLYGILSIDLPPVVSELFAKGVGTVKFFK